MNKDIVVYNKETREIIAILTNIDSFEDIILNKQFDYDRVDSNKPYIKGDGEKLYYANEGKIINLEEYRRLYNE